MADLFSGCDLLIGMDVVLCLGGVNIDSLGKVCLIDKQSCNVSVQLHHSTEDYDFSANFDGEKWVVKLKWCSGKEPSLHNKKVSTKWMKE